MLSEAVAAALESAPIDDRDAAAAALTRHYASLIDDAAPTAPLAKAIEALDAYIPLDPRTQEAWRRVRAALAQHSATRDLGPKLLAGLDSLGLTTRARKPVAKPEEETPHDKPVNPLDELRRRRESRTRRAAGDD